MEFTYASDERQIYYSPARAALGEYVNYGHGWKFDGWLWDGQVTSRDDAVAKTASYVGIFHKEGQQTYGGEQNAT